ncbi:MAG: hypothetical protein KDK66_06155 [Deltaproteobacteria bacterium]|nr:hypothetical protein [Deltaproteobacteria bacterium]
MKKILKITTYLLSFLILGLGLFLGVKILLPQHPTETSQVQNFQKNQAKLETLRQQIALNAKDSATLDVKTIQNKEESLLKELGILWISLKPSGEIDLVTSKGGFYFTDSLMGYYYSEKTPQNIYECDPQKYPQEPVKSLETFFKEYSSIECVYRVYRPLGGAWYLYYERVEF